MVGGLPLALETTLALGLEAFALTGGSTFLDGGAALDAFLVVVAFRGLPTFLVAALVDCLVGAAFCGAAS